VKELLRVKPGEDSLLLSGILRYNIIIIDESVNDKDEVLIGGASIILLV